MGKMKESPRYNVIAVRVTDEDMRLLKFLSKKRKTTYSQLIREALASADFPSSMIAEDDKRLLCTG
jgi:hypothetical protein